VVDFVEKRVDLAGGPVFYRVGGAGPPLLYLHGAGGAQVSPALRALSDAHRIYAPVLPGFDDTTQHVGAASMPALAAIIRAFVTSAIGDRLDLIGHSFGGLLAMWLALDDPDWIIRLVLGCPAGIVAGTPPRRGESPEAILRRLCAYPERRSTDTRSAATIQANRAIFGCYYAGGFMADKLIAGLATITCPTLILGGACDGIVPPATGRLLRSRLPNSRLTYIDDAAHTLETDQPEAYERVVREFLESGDVLLDPNPSPVIRLGAE
jgi:pimeloyl-ACP methyl ester carboxylesterase